MSQIQPENVAMVFTDKNTGKAYAILLEQLEVNIVMPQIEALRDGCLKAREVKPFEIRSVRRPGDGEASS
ncbi:MULTISPECIES: hypothetical protein [unclassified Serratia (in: enterobacteria)]|uniref:hypothetical protein n=1 Tax=unclassified Serratia (in: enterobacteria) TaxID=2647522 RepID=UPI0005006ADD|nr:MULTISPECIES: hypothetical protein [unclassified Serratia (in: enterobacteria)]KFK93584.1 hypothetical protein JV45_15710 [Serratia sp. Ag2]KFK93851.1 hypothetical protein IV04_23425 [Serratia sp. Ag1]